MGKLNEVQEQTTQSYGSNSFTTRIKENTVEFDSAKDKFTFLDPVEVPGINIGGTSSVPFTSEDRVKLDNLQTPMQIKGRVDSVSELPTEGVKIGDTYLVGLSGSETFDEYVCVGLSGSPEVPAWESVGGTQVQSDWNQNDSTKSDYIKNRICYTENGVMESIYDDTVTGFTSVEQMGIYVNGAQVDVTSTMDIESFDGDNYVITVLGKSYEVEPQTYGTSLLYVYGDESDLADVDTNGLKMISIGIQVEMGTQTKTLAVGIACTQELTSTSVKIETLAEGEVHQLDEKYIPDTIARTSDIPEAAFELDDENFNIYPNFTNDSNTVNTENSLILSAPSTSNNSFGGGNNISILASNSGNTISGGANIAITTASSTTVGGNNNTVISSYGGSQSMGDSEYGSIIIGGVGGISMSGGGYQKVAINAGYGTSITGSHSTVISSAAVIGASNSTVIGVASGSARTITAGDSHMILGGDGSPKTISNGSNNSIIGSGYSSIENGSTNLILGCSSASITGSSTYTCAMISAAGGSAIQGGSGNMIIGGASSAPATIPSTVSGCIVLGGGVTNPTESNMVYVPALNAVNGVKTKKMTIAGIDPADVFMHSEIIDASSDVAFSRVIANTASTKTDGYVEILYKASSGVTCSAYIDSTDVTLTADGAWHKLEQGCNPANGVEIHINNPSPVTDATLEVISKVYYI